MLNAFDERFFSPEWRVRSDSDRRTDQQQRLEQLESERVLLAELLQGSSGAVVVIRGPMEVIQYAIDTFCRLFDVSDVVGRPLFQVLPELARQGFAELVSGVRTSGITWSGRAIRFTRAERSSADSLYADLTCSRLRDTPGEEATVVIHLRDVTLEELERVQLRAALEREQLQRENSDRHREMAEAVVRSKNEMLAILGHELRTPLHSIACYSDLIGLGIRGPVTKQQQLDLERIQASQRHMTALIEDVLSAARTEGQSRHFAIQPVDVAEAMAEAEVLVLPQAQEKNQQLIVEPCASHIAVRADKEKLRQVIVNLLVNAIKFTGRSGSIVLRPIVTDDAVNVCVHDTGCGVPDDQLERIFEPFTQIASDPNLHNGIGLGLAISRDLIRRMGGDLVATSRLGAGSTFTLTLRRSS